MIYNQDVFFVLILFSFLLIALLRGIYWKHAKLLFMSVFAQRYANQYLREDNAFTERVSLLTFLLMVINFTMIIAKFKQTLDIYSVAIICLMVLVFFFLKLLMIHFLGLLFKIKDLAKLAIFFSFLFDKTLGFVLFPLVVFMYFFTFDVLSAVLTISIVLFCIFLLLKLFWLLKIGSNSFGLSQMYIFLYLCAFEISPILLLVKGVFY